MQQTNRTYNIAFDEEMILDKILLVSSNCSLSLLSNL